ncbi:hypothetical protein [Adhaeribacter pallidiroseus]|uniref:Uncharacterized protein n=1 Tax=Adhaeribacter pallidiroseus TaxID=2072847 RepID=A0A369QKT4_9BACT|nr:hypothetical protein [Adhaeribacter pallidiroseus]RDC63459.1 hypothetical protein AHMF7616_02063 [Adhaeribacter pallidiroseus]
MRKLVLIVLFLWLVHPFSYAQLIERERAFSRVDTYPIGGSLRISRDHPLIIIGSLETNLPSLILDPENLQIVKTYQEPAEIKYFGDKGVNGVLVGELKTKIPLLKLDEVLDYFEIPAANRHLPVMVDRNLVDPNLFLADVHRIKKIEVFEVTQQDVLSSLIYNHWVEVVGEKYLNIITMED